MWAVLMDKSYKGASEMLRVIIYKNKPINGSLSREDRRFNVKVSADQILVENYFERLGQLCSIISSRFKWNESIIDVFFRFCGAITDIHVKINPLCSEDNEWNVRYRNRLIRIGEERYRKRSFVQKRYRSKRRIRLSLKILGSESVEVEDNN